MSVPYDEFFERCFCRQRYSREVIFSKRRHEHKYFGFYRNRTQNLWWDQCTVICDARTLLTKNSNKILIKILIKILLIKYSFYIILCVKFTQFFQLYTLHFFRMKSHSKRLKIESILKKEWKYFHFLTKVADFHSLDMKVILRNEISFLKKGVR